MSQRLIYGFVIGSFMSPLFRLCPDERHNFCVQRYELVFKCAEEGSKMISKVDLIMPLLEFWNASRILMKPNAKESAD